MILQCPNCQAPVNVPDGMTGQVMRCSACQKELTVPAKPSAPTARPPEAPASKRLSSLAGIDFGDADVGALPEKPVTQKGIPAPSMDMSALGEFGAVPSGPARPMLGKENEKAGRSLGPEDETLASRFEGYGKAAGGAASGAMDLAKGAAGGVGEAASSLPVLGDIVKSFQPLVSAFGKVGSVVSSIFGGAKGGKAEGDGKAEGGKSEGGKEGATSAGGEGEGPKSKMAMVGEALGAVASVASAVVNSFTALVGVAGSFVQQFNPSLMGMLNMTMRDFQATIGSGLTPVIQTAIGSLRFLADALVEPMKALRPAVASISSAFGGLLNSLSSLLGQVLTALAPALGVVGQLLGAVSSILQGMVSGIGAVVSILSPFINLISGIFGALLTPVEGIASLFGDLMRAVAAVAAGIGATLGAAFEYLGAMLGGTGGLFKSLGTAISGAIQWFIKAGLTIAAMVGKFIGGTAFLDGMIKSLSGPKEGGSIGMAAAQNAQVTNIGSVTNALYAAAFTAQKVGPDSKKDDPMKDMVETLKQMKDGSGSTIQDAIEAAAPAIANALKTVITGAAAGAAEYVGGGIYGAGRSAAGYVGNALGLTQTATLEN